MQKIEDTWLPDRFHEKSQPAFITSLLLLLGRWLSLLAMHSSYSTCPCIGEHRELLETGVMVSHFGVFG